jgi:hypothetical protein
MIPPSDRQQIFRPRHLTVTRPTEIFARMSHVLLAQSYGILELRRALNRSSTKWEPANAALRPQRPPCNWRIVPRRRAWCLVGDSRSVTKTQSGH